MEAKPFAVGVRIQHLQGDIDKAMFGKYDKILHPASYKLTYTTKNKRGVYSFCMCPGGYVVNASSEEKKLCINGMSYQARDSKNANSAIVVSVTPKDFGESALDGIAYQRELEEKAYLACQGKIPTQRYEDFVLNQVTTSFGKIKPMCKGSVGFANLREVFPSYIVESIIEAMPSFGKKIKGFDVGDALLFGVESRTSSPVRIIRDEFGQSSVSGIYPCGEGAGYAGGIVTAAMDGIKTFENIVKY